MTFWQHQSVVKCWQIKMKCFKWVLELKKIRSENNLRFQNKGNLWSICKYNWDTLGWPKLLGNDDIDLRIDINDTDTSCVPKNKATTKRNETNRSDQLKENYLSCKKYITSQQLFSVFCIIIIFFLNLNFFYDFCYILNKYSLGSDVLVDWHTAYQVEILFSSFFFFCFRLNFLFLHKSEHIHVDFV